MEIKRLSIKNIRSYEDQEIVFPEGSLLLAGDIGSGKTSILLALEYALFGLQPGQKGSSLLRNNSDIGEVSLDFEVEGKNVTITRMLKRGAKSITSENSSISINGRTIEASTTEIKTRILSLLCYPQEFIKKNNLLYRYTVYTPQEQMKQIILEDRETRLNVLRHIFGIDKYKRIRENLLVIQLHLKEESKFLQGEIKTLEEDRKFLEETKNSVDNLNIAIKEKESVLSAKIETRKVIEIESEQLSGKILEKDKFEREIEKTKILILSKREALTSLEKEAAEISKAISDLKEEFNDKEYNNTVAELEKSRKDLDIFNSEYIEIVGQLTALEKGQDANIKRRERIFKIDICPTCLQNVSEHHKHTISIEAEKEIKEIKGKIDFLINEKSLIIGKIENLKKKKSSLEERKYNLELLKSRLDYTMRSKEKLISINKNKERLEKDISLLVKHIENLKEAILSFSKFDNLYRTKQEELKNAILGERTAEILLAEYKKEMELTIRQVDIFKRTIKKKEESKKRLENIMDLSEWLSNKFIALIDFTERNVMIKLRLEFSKIFNKWFSILAGDTLEVQLDESFTPLIIQNDTEMDYSFLSGGERTAVALAYRLALNQTINSILSQIKTRDIVILDEPTEGFSEAQIEKMRDVFYELNARQLIIVSHENEMEDFVDNIMRIKKKGNISSIEKSSEDFNSKTESDIIRQKQ